MRTDVAIKSVLVSNIEYDNSMSDGTQIEWIASVSGPEAVEVVLRLSKSVLVSNMCAKNRDVEDR